MKRSTLILTVLLPVFGAINAAAQFNLNAVRLAVPLSPVLQLPMRMPGPVTGPLADEVILLPSPVSPLMPPLSLPAPARFPVSGTVLRMTPAAPAKTATIDISNEQFERFFDGRTAARVLPVRAAATPSRRAASVARRLSL